MADVKKVTKKDTFNTIKTLLADNEEIVAFCNHEIELLEKKASKKSTKIDTKNEKIIFDITNVLNQADKPMLVKDIIKALRNLNAEEYAEVTSQKVSAMLKKIDNVTNEKTSKGSFFSLSNEVTDEEEGE